MISWPTIGLRHGKEREKVQREDETNRTWRKTFIFNYAIKCTLQKRLCKNIQHAMAPIDFNTILML
jgi:hypothetical protein